MSLKKLFIITILLVSFGAHYAVQAETISASNPHKIEPNRNSKVNAKTEHYLKRAQEALRLADSNAPPQSYHYELIAADFYIQAGALNEAKPLLEMLSYSSLPRSLKTFKEQLEREYHFKEQQQTTSPESLQAYNSTNTRCVALFLPLSGTHAQAAQAIKAGFLAQHQAQIQNESTPVEIKVYDTSQTSELGTLYGKALADGAHFIIGPLMKTEVQALRDIAQAGSPVPILALNVSSDIKQPGLDNFFQFALSPEEEAQLLAQKAWEDGHRSTSIIVPDNEWGKRVLHTFCAKWQSLGGKIPSTALINNQHNPDAAIRKLLQVRTNTKPVSRRQDIDMIVLAVPPTQARQLRPLLNFYYANDLAIYSTSSIYQGTPQPQQDSDLNGIIFCDMPWILENRHDNNHPFHHSARLYAMGLDAYQLVSRLTTLSESPNTEYQGATGTLSIGSNHIIERKLNWAQIKDGVPQSYEPKN